MESTVYLLGAGASYDAGLPMSLGLTDKIGELISEKEAIEPCPFAYEPEVGLRTQAYYAIRALLQAGDVHAGRPPTIGVDIERIFSAAQALATLDDNDLTAFVQQWREPFNIQPDPLQWKQFVKSIQEYDPETWEHHILGSPPTPPAIDLQQIFSWLCVTICEVLPLALRAESPEKHSYLLPMLRGPESPRIATLNYDLGVELTAQSAGLSVDTGITSWRGGLRWNWGSGVSDIQLLKLHGSLDWGRPYADGGALPLGAPRVTHIESDDYYLDRAPSHVDIQPPGLIFGLRNKLRPDGPFMAMLNEFWRWLEHADRVIVIGYSFRDEHINTLLDDWITLNPSRTLDIVDPSVPDDLPRFALRRPSVVSWVMSLYLRDTPGCPDYPSDRCDDLHPRVSFHRQGAADWLRSGAAGL